jgi:hypothetical protein
MTAAGYDLMLDTAAEIRLQTIFRRENRSLLQYVRQAAPWADQPDRDRLQRVNDLADAELDALGELAAFLDAHHAPLPYLGAFPTEFTDHNFIALRKLLPLLIDDHRRGVDQLQQDCAALPGPARAVAERLLEAKRKHLAELESL